MNNFPPISARIYISGQISGLGRNEFMERFAEAERLLREAGYTNIVNPTRLWFDRWPWVHRLLNRVLGEQTVYAVILLYDLWVLMRCQRIYKIPGWKESRGANIESAVAFNMGLYTLMGAEREMIDKGMEQFLENR